MKKSPTPPHPLHPLSPSPLSSSTQQVVLLPDSSPDVPAPARDWEVVLLPDSFPDVPAPAQVVLLPDSSPDVPALARDREVVLLPAASLDVPAPAHLGHLSEVHSSPKESLHTHRLVGGGLGPNRSDNAGSATIKSASEFTPGFEVPGLECGTMNGRKGTGPQKGLHLLPPCSSSIACCVARTTILVIISYWICVDCW